ncbi:hypothetical protein GBAR_LOCUS14033, partial [Geodia barretti]
MQVLQPVGAPVLILAAVLVTTYAASCTVDSQDKCRCSESASSLLDVGCIFKYPYEFHGTIDDTTYTFRFSPCGDTECEPQNGTVSISLSLPLSLLSAATSACNSQT